jgi:DinB superfamily
MLNFQAVRNKEITLAELVAGLMRDDLGDLTNEMVDTMLGLIAACVDADVTFEPVDLEAHDPFAEKPEEVSLAWNLGHVIVHTTASAEEAAAVAAELARGVEYHGRSRYEVPWREMRTIEGCRQRLEESWRMRLASLETWPDEAHLKNEYVAWSGGPTVNAIGRFALGLMHDDSHLEQIRKIVHQAQMARGQ